MPQREPHIDFTRIPFPSDALSFGLIRKRFPQLIDAPTAKVTFFNLPESNPVFHGECLTNLLEGEREVALFAFHAALGKPWTHPSYTEKQIKDFLTEYYVRYGVATGKHHARELIHAIETRAAAQVRGRRP